MLQLEEDMIVPHGRYRHPTDAYLIVQDCFDFFVCRDHDISASMRRIVHFDHMSTRFQHVSGERLVVASNSNRMEHGRVLSCTSPSIPYQAMNSQKSINIIF